MASNFEQEVYDGGGYDVKVIENFPEGFNCGICHSIIKQATHGCVNHVFCKICLHQHIQHGVRDGNNVTCPGGCREVIDQSNLQPNQFTDRMINKLKTKCKHDGCQWDGDLLDLVQVHQINCEYQPLSCNYDGCEITVFKKTILQHSVDCLYRIVECDYCQIRVIYMNKGNHEIECSNEKVDCLYYKIGCQVKVCRKDVTLHESTYHVTHTRMMYESFKDENSFLKQENIELKKQFIELEKKSSEQLKTFKEAIQIKAIEINQLKETFNEALQIKAIEIDQIKEVVTNNVAQIHLLQKDDQKLKGVQKQQNIGQGVKMKEKTVEADLKIKENNIMRLKKGISDLPDLKRSQVSLLYDDTVLYFNRTVDIFSYYTGISSEKLAKCYENRQFDGVINKYSFKEHKKLMLDLLHEIPYHLYEFDTLREASASVYFCFPMDLDNVKALNLSIPDKFKMKITAGEIVVERSNTNMDIRFTLYIGHYFFQGVNKVRVDLHRRNFINEMAFSFGDYACLYYYECVSSCRVNEQYENMLV